VKSDAYYGKWRVHGRQVMRKLGPRREPGTRIGLTRAQAEARLRELMAETSLPASTERLTFEEMGRRYIAHLEEVMQRKRATIQDYRIMLLRHLGPFFGATEVAKLDAADVTAYIAAKRRSGLAVKTITNH
jgi:integrase